MAYFSRKKPLHPNISDGNLTEKVSVEKNPWQFHGKRLPMLLPSREGLTVIGASHHKPTRGILPLNSRGPRLWSNLPLPAPFQFHLLTFSTPRLFLSDTHQLNKERGQLKRSVVALVLSPICVIYTLIFI